MKTTFLRKFARKTQLIGASLAIVLAIPAAAYAFGPDRPTFDFTKGPVNGSTCTQADEAAHDQCGSLTGPVFDSFMNAPGYGDERNFTTISPATAGDTNPIDNSYSETATAQAGQEYWLRIYVHNNANQGLNCSSDHRDPTTGDCSQLDPGSIGIATDTHVRLAYSTGRANGQDLKAYIDAKDAQGNPVQEVWDSAQLTNDSTQFRVQYEPGTAHILTNSQNTNLQTLPNGDAITSADGVAVGQNLAGTADNSGNFPGCFSFASRIYVKVLVKAPVIKVTKQAFIAGTHTSVEGQTVDPGTALSYDIHYYNVGNDDATDLTVRDTMSGGATFVPGTLLWSTADQTNVQQDSQHEDVFFNQGGIDFGNFAALTADEQAQGDDSGLVTYKANASSDPSVCQIVNTVAARSAGTPEVSATSTVNVKCAQPATLTSTTTPPAALPNTGPGSIVGLFAGVTIGGALFHRLFLSRRLAARRGL